VPPSEQLWHTLLSEPMAVVGPYRGSPPRLSSFAAHALRIDVDVVCLAGQFFDLPTQVPQKWLVGTRATAYAVFQFLPVRRCELVGTLAPVPEDDSPHQRPVGRHGQCDLLPLQDTFFHNPDPGCGCLGSISPSRLRASRWSLRPVPSSFTWAVRLCVRTGGQMRPNPSFEARPNGRRPGPRCALVHDAPRGPGLPPSVPPQLQR
jgi:hypothetical protein